MDLLNTAFKSHKNMVYLKKKNFEIFYSCDKKYPLLVVETIDNTTGKTLGSKKIIRSEIEDPFKEDENLPKKCRHTLKDYNNYMEYGGSLGHNAPAGNHKLNVSVYNETFLLSNMSPQEIVFNSGLWVVLETWCKRLQNEVNLYDIKVFTGSIPSKKTTKLNNTEMNIPSHMFKVVSCKHKKHNGIFFIACFLMKNEPPKEKIFKIYKYLVSLKHISNLTRINFFKIFTHYQDFNPIDYKISSINKISRIDVKFNNMLSRQMYSSSHYGLIIYSKTLQELDNNWKKTVQAGFGDEFHEYYYKLCKSRLTKHKSKKTKLKKSKSKKSKSKKSKKSKSKKSKSKKSKSKKSKSKKSKSIKLK